MPVAVGLGTSLLFLPSQVCKFKAHKRCAVRATNNCKWTTLASIGTEIIEDEDGVSVPPTARGGPSRQGHLHQVVKVMGGDTGTSPALLVPGAWGPPLRCGRVVARR